MEGGGGRLRGEINTFSYLTLYKTPLSTIHVQLYDKNNNSNITNLGHFPFNSWKYNLSYLGCIKFMFFFVRRAEGFCRSAKQKCTHQLPVVFSTDMKMESTIGLLCKLIEFLFHTILFADTNDQKRIS